MPPDLPEAKGCWLSHLFYAKRQPAFQWLQQTFTGQFDGLRAERFLMREAAT